MRVLIIGCGYVGRPLGLELARLGHEVFGLRRTAVDPGESLPCFTGDVAVLDDLKKLPGPFDWVVNTVSSSKGGVEDYQRAYFGGTKNILEWLGACPPKKYVYTSSTSVYAQNDGSMVKESSPAEPATETGVILRATEQLLLDAANTIKFPAVVLRVAGIYGPERGHLFLQYLRDEATIAGQGERLINMIHRDDVAGAIIAALKSGRPGEIYNAVDDEPVPQIHFFRWLSETLGKNMPPFGASPTERKRGVTSKKISNRKLKMELGYQFRFPTFRQGYTAEIQRLQDAGKL
ncbi:MAG TPA: SDR family oxidoreductase [Verrucomicrobiae bacterium]|jgi:nucleoside-diphosphate-sugar epimerase|nr:SDR family oxidoreductase [Verrucomicrobiae bacterium]